MWWDQGKVRNFCFQRESYLFSIGGENQEDVCGKGGRKIQLIIKLENEDNNRDEGVIREKDIGLRKLREKGLFLFGCFLERKEKMKKKKEENLEKEWKWNVYIWDEKKLTKWMNRNKEKKQEYICQKRLKAKSKEYIGWRIR